MHTELLEKLTLGHPLTVQHYKKKSTYRVIGVGEHTDTHQQHVMYQSISYPEPNKIWVRSLEEFCAMVEDNGQLVPRFSILNINY